MNVCKDRMREKERDGKSGNGWREEWMKGKKKE